MKFEQLIKQVLRYNKNANITLIDRAYNLSKRTHKNEKRLSGESEINHPLRVAYILADIKADDTTIADLVKGMKKTPKIVSPNKHDEESLRKCF